MANPSQHELFKYAVAGAVTSLTAYGLLKMKRREAERQVNTFGLNKDDSRGLVDDDEESTDDTANESRENETVYAKEDAAASDSFGPDDSNGNEGSDVGDDSGGGSSTSYASADDSGASENSTSNEDDDTSMAAEDGWSEGKAPTEAQPDVKPTSASAKQMDLDTATSRPGLVSMRKWKRSRGKSPDESLELMPAKAAEEKMAESSEYRQSEDCPEDHYKFVHLASCSQLGVTCQNASSDADSVLSTLSSVADAARFASKSNSESDQGRENSCPDSHYESVHILAP